MKRFYTALVLLVFVFAAHSRVSCTVCVYHSERLAGSLTVYDTVKNKKVTTIDVGGNGSPFCYRHESRWKKGLCCQRITSRIGGLWYR